MYKKDWILSNLQLLICHMITNQIKLRSSSGEKWFTLRKISKERKITF